MQRLALALPWLLALPACGSENSGGSGSGSQGSTTSGTDGSSEGTGGGASDGSATEGSGGTASGGASTSTAPPPDEPPPATGIQIVDVTADQGVRVPIVVGGSLVPGNQRNLPLLKNRNTMIRAFYELDPGYAQRDIFATLWVTTGGETYELTSFETAFEDTSCAGQNQYECRYRSMSQSFNFLVPGEQIQPDTEYRIALLETAPGHENDPSDKIPEFPIDGSTMIIGVEDSYMKMRVVIVPFDHDVGADCPEPPDLNAPWTGMEGDDPIATFMGRNLLAQNPADEVEIVVHDTVTYTGSATSSSGLLNRLQQLRSSDGAPPGWYYYGVIRPCGGGPGFSGVAQLGSPNTSSASRRVGWGVWHSSLTSTTGTFVHEVGHEQGRQHIACTGDEGGPDPNYPDHPEGDLVDEYGTPNWGIEVYGPQIDVHPPDDHDYMSYCSSTWVSEWGYDMVLPWIAEISSWEGGDTVPDPQELLHGYVQEDGTIAWWIGLDYWDRADVSEGHAIVWPDGGRIARTPALRIDYERSNDYMIVAPVPPGFDGSAMEISWTDGKALHAIDRSSIQRIHPVDRK